MVNQEDLLRAIINSPDEDAPRLVYADCLDEQGDSDRAAFIRTQITRASLPEDHPRQSELEAREWRLLSRCGAGWLNLPPRSVIRGEYRKGFFEVLGTSGSRWLEHREHFLQQFPLRVLRLGKITRLSPEQRLARLEELNAPQVTIEGERDSPLPVVRADEFLPSLAKMPELEKLRGLDFALLQDFYGAVSNEIGDTVLADFLQAPALRKMESLGLVSTQLGDRSLEILSDPSWRNLHHLDLSWNGESAFTFGAFWRFSQSSTWRRLERLNLMGTQLPPMAHEQLAEAFARSGIRDLTLFDNVLAPLEALCLAETPAGLRRLRCGVYSHIDFVLPDALAQRLFASSSIAGLHALELDCRLTNCSLAAIVQSPHLRQLRTLRVRMNETPSSDTIDQLLQAPFIENLTHLSCWNLADEHLVRLARCPRFHRLRGLTVGVPRCEEASVQALLTSRYFPNLTALYLGWKIPYTTDLIRLLQDPPCMPHLTCLTLEANWSKPWPKQELMGLFNAPRFAFVNPIFGDDDLLNAWDSRFGSWPFFQRERVENA
jgi:uncharacterized protein (TIGR02996 family)